MSADETFPLTGVIPSEDIQHVCNIDQLTTAVLDDIFYNVIHDLVLQTHNAEKVARANSAATAVERKAHSLSPSPDSDTGAPRPVRTETAQYANNETTLIKNPLATVTDILCPKCGLTLLLYPLDGKGSRKPDRPLDHYCKARPYIDKPDHDIYGQTYKPEGPGRGKRKEVMEKKEPVEGTPPPDAPRQNISFPHAKCQNCSTHIPIRRMNKHMVKCIGGGGRNAAKNANANMAAQSGSQNGSRNGTPAPNGKNSPSKRSLEGSDSDSPVKKKKLLKKTAAGKLKGGAKMARSSSQASKLSYESRAEDDDEDDDGEYGSGTQEKRKKKVGVARKKDLPPLAGPKKKWKFGSGTVGGAVKPLPPDVTKVKKSMSPDSSQTLSSPNE